MWSLGASPALFLLLGLVIGLAVLAGTVVSAWNNRSQAATRRARRASALASLSVGLLGLLHWVVFEEKPIYSFETIVILVLYTVPTFVISYYISSSWLRRAVPKKGNE